MAVSDFQRLAIAFSVCAFALGISVSCGEIRRSRVETLRRINSAPRGAEISFFVGSSGLRSALESSSTSAMNR